jgi:hypothetical protein
VKRWKSVEFHAQNDAGAVDKLTVTFNIAADGKFYANVPIRLKSSFEERYVTYNPRVSGEHFTVSAPTFAELEKAIKRAHDLLLKPKITEEFVIQYNIGSNVSFAVNADGKIFPNAGYPGARWLTEKEMRKNYGDHDASNRASGGYSLTVGAKAMIKKTIAYGENVSYEYDLYYKGESHLGHKNPAQKLNSWTSFSLPDNAKEMPYTDEAAMFFYGLMMSMAELNRRIQEFTNTPEKIALAIQRHSNLLMLDGPGKPSAGREEGR